MLIRIKPLGWIALGVSIALLFIGINQLAKNESVTVLKENEKKIKNNVESKIEKDLLSKFPGLQLQNETYETDNYTFFISTPVTESEEINNDIDAWIIKEKENFLTEVEENNDVLKDGFIAHLNIQVNTTLIADNMYNLVFNTYQAVGGANGKTKTKTFTIDIENNKVIELKDLFYTDFEETIAAISKIIEQKLKEIDKLDLIQDNGSNLLKTALKDPIDWKWSLNDEYLQIYFDQYEIASGSEGIIQVDIPTNEVILYLRSDLASKLQLEIKDTQEEIEKEEARIKKENEKKAMEKEEEDNQQAGLDPKGKYIALTFDDGPSQSVTPRILDTLKQYNAKATFYMLGSQVDYYPAVADMVAKAGHEIGSHTENHLDLTKVNNQSIYNEIATANEKIKKSTGLDHVKTVRPPYGAYNDNVKNIISEYHSSIVMWSVDSLDWKSRNAQAINKLVLETANPGAIVLMHDIHPTTADALPSLMEALKNDGYEFVTVSELLALQGKSGIGPHYGSY